MQEMVNDQVTRAYRDQPEAVLVMDELCGQQPSWPASRRMKVRAETGCETWPVKIEKLLDRGRTASRKP